MVILSFATARVPSPPATFRTLGKALFRSNSQVAMRCSAISGNFEQSKLVWVWTESKQVMTAAVERGWSTFIFPSEPRYKEVANDWSSIALIQPLFIEGSGLFDEQNRRVASFYDVSSPQELEFFQQDDNQTDNVVINFPGEWQVIPAENIVAAFQGCKKTVLAVSTASARAQVFLEALEQGLDGVVLKVEDIGDVFKLKDYFDRRNEAMNLLSLTKATVTRLEAVGMGDRVCVDLCSLMRPGEGLLVGSFARGLFLVHSECLESNYIASRPFRVNALFEAQLQGPVHAYVAVPGGRTCYLSELRAGNEVVVVDQKGLQRTAIVGRVKIESRPLILVEAKDVNDNTYSIFLQNAETVGLVCPLEGDNTTRTTIPVTSLKVGDEVMLRLQGGARLDKDVNDNTYSIFLQNAETVGLVCPLEGDNTTRTTIPVTSLKVGDEVMLRLQGGARHTGLEIQEFILEK